MSCTTCTIFLASTRNSNWKCSNEEKGNYVQNLQDRKIYRCVQRPDLVSTTLNNLTRNVSVNRYAELFSVTVVKGAAGEILDS